MTSFKLYNDTTFDTLKIAACKYWEISSPDDYVITDEYFNVLSTYKDTVQNFFEEQAGYKPLNSLGNDVFASCFLMKKDSEKRYLHELQIESVQIQDDDKQKDNNEAD